MLHIIQNLLKSKTLKPGEIKALEKLIDSFSNGTVQWTKSPEYRVLS